MVELPVLALNTKFCLIFRMNFCVWVVFVSSLLSCCVHPLADDTGDTYDVLYTRGTRAYMQERWYECMSLMQNALKEYHHYRDSLASCRIRCQSQSKSQVDSTEHFELSFFENSLYRSNCLRRCKRKKLGKRNESIVSREILTAFETLLPYDYLQICAYKAEKFEEAATAAFTFLSGNPKHETMQDNVAFYRDMPEIKADAFHDVEAKKHQVMYQKAVDAYADGDYLLATSQMEEAVEAYHLAYEECSALCEGPYDHESLPDLYNAVADHWIKIVDCKLECPLILATVQGETLVSYLPEHYNYLQFSYFKVGQLDKAAECAATYMLLKPGDETMKGNVEFYQAEPSVSTSDFTPREITRKYAEELKLLSQMKEFISYEYRFSDADIDVQGLDEPAPDETESNNNSPEETNPLPLDKSLFGPRDKAFSQSLDAYNKEHGVSLVAENEALEGHHRVAADGFLTEEECQDLMKLADVGARTGDGYSTKTDQTSPHTLYERFAGLTVSSAAELASSGTVSPALSKLYLKASEMGRAWLEKYYNLNTPLYFSFTHLVCRTALDKDQRERRDLSHPVHADNCFIQPDGSCLKQAPAYTMRDLTGLIYLNEDFEGGNFFFAFRNQTIQKTVRPKCGRMVGFESSDYHGVEALTKGRRCAVAIWYTLDPQHQETSHAEAYTTLSALENKDKAVKNLELKSYLDEKDYELKMTEEELNGPERFAVDGLMDEETCQSLIKLANDGALVGDGYRVADGKTSPFTDAEIFAGLTVGDSAKAGGVVGDGYSTDTKTVTSPHTNHEQFEGLTILRSAQLAAEGKVDLEAVKLYLSSSEAGRKMVHKYFNLDQELYFTFTHLVCRLALDEKKLDRTDLSHPVHSDNCIIQPDNSCKKERPAYIERDYSAILYLNDDFLGGEFFFAHQNMSIQSSLRPKCGRLVGFNSSNYHGVKAVLKGQRCAVAMWFTLDQKFKESAHSVAWNIVDSLKGKPLGPPMHGEL